MLSILGVTGGHHSEAAVFRAFSNRLRSESRNWLLIIDSADSEDILLHVPAGDETEGQGERCIDYLRPCNHGSVLLTTRTQHVALKVVDYKDIVTVNPMEREHALALLEKKLGKEYTSEEVNRLAVELDFIPLAMVQAASFIMRRAPRGSVAAYIAEFVSISGKRKRKRGEEDLRRDRDAANTIFSAWQISFKHVLKARRSAILSLIHI